MAHPSLKSILQEHVEDPLLRRYYWSLHPSHLATESPYEVACLFVASLLDKASPLAKGTTLLHLAPINTIVQILTRFLVLYTSLGRQKIIAESLASRVLQKRYSLVRTCAPPSLSYLGSPLCSAIVLAAAYVGPKGWALHESSRNPLILSQQMYRKAFPFHRIENIVSASNTQSILFTFIQEETTYGIIPVLLVPGILFPPHTSVIPCAAEKGVRTVGYEVNLTSSYSVDTDQLAINLKQFKKNEKVFMVLPSISGRRIDNIQDVCLLLRKYGGLSIDLRIPTVDMEGTPFDSQLGVADLTIVSFQTVCCLGGALGSFKQGSSAIRCRVVLECLKKPSNLLLWLAMMRETVQYFISSRLGFSLAIHALALFSRSIGLIPEAGNLKRECAQRTRRFSENLLKNKKIPFGWNADTKNGMHRAHSTQVGNILLFFTKRYQESVMDSHCEVLWDLLSRLPPYINVISVGCERPLQMTAVGSAGILLRVHHAQKLVDILIMEGFEAVHLLPRSSVAVQALEELGQDEIVYFPNSKVGSNEHQRFVFVPLNPSVSASQREKLLQVLAHSPKEFFGDDIRRDYNSNDVKSLLQAIKSKRRTNFSKL